MSSVFRSHGHGEDTRHLLACPGCEEDLDVLQPDVDTPDRLLAICRHCKSWYLADGEGRLKPIRVDD